MKTHIAVVLGFVSTLCSSFVLDDPCTVHISQQGPQIAKMHTDVANGACLNGSIWWSSPKGTLQVIFNPKGHTKFRVCLRSDMDPVVEAMYEVTETGRRRLDTSPEEKEVCAETIDGKVTIEFVAPEFLLAYMTLYDYSIVFDSK